MANADHGASADPVQALLELLSKSGDALEVASPAFELEPGAARLRYAARDLGLFLEEAAPENELAISGDAMEEESPPFDVDVGAARLGEAGRVQGLLQTVVTEDQARIERHIALPVGATSQDLRYWRNWAGYSGSVADGDEAIERFTRLVAGPDPDGEWDRCRLVLAGLLANRAGRRLITGWAEPETTGEGWADARTALDLFTRAAASPALDADLRDRAKIAHSRLTAGVATLRAAHAMTGGRIPDIGALQGAAVRLAGDEYGAMARLASDLVAMMSGGQGALTSERQKAIEGVKARMEQAGLEQADLATPPQSLMKIGLGILVGSTR